MNRIVNSVLNEFRKQVKSLVLRCESAMGGPSVELMLAPDPENLLSDASDAVDRYLADIAAQVILVCDEVEEDEALDFVMDRTDDCAEAGHIPELPDETADAHAQAVWLGKASTYGLAGEILQLAKEHFGVAEQG